jgi:hypothetical protein
MRVNGHPVRLVVVDDLRRSRLTVFFRWLLAIPHVIWLLLWTVAAVVAAFGAWIVALFTGRVPAGLHGFLAAYVRYLTHLGSYLTLITNPYPAFTGERGYPVEVELPDPERQSRWTIAFRSLFLIPAALLATVLGSGFHTAGLAESARTDGDPTFYYVSIGGALAAVGLLGWFASLFLGRMPHNLRELGAYSIGYGAQTWAYALLLTDRYPNSDPDEVRWPSGVAAHQVSLDLSDDGRRSRVTVFFRLLLAIPHFVWLLLWSIAAFFAAIGNGLIALIRGRSADTLHRFLVAYVRYTAHVVAFVSLVANPFPGFTGDPGYPVDIVIGQPERQNRWITLFRTFLVIPALIVSSALSGVLAVIALLGWFTSLATGRMPTGMRNLGAGCVRYLSQTNAYWFVVTDAYPDASPALRRPPEPDPVYADPFEPLPEAV